MAKKKDELVVKHNRLVEASYRLSLIEQQVVLFAICRCREEQRGLFADMPVTIRAVDFATQFGLNTEDGNVYRQLKDAMDTLFSRHVIIHDTDPKTEKPRVTKSRWISQASYIEGAGHIQFIFAPAVIPFITKLGESGEFTSYRLEKIGRMTSTYAVRMYEILVQYLSIGKRDIELDWLRKTLCIEGEYLRVMDFKTWVLDVAMTQINTHSDIIVSYQQRKTGRIITHFDFTIMDKAKVSAKKPKPKVKNSTKGSDPRAKPGESQDAFDHRMLEKKGQQQLI